MAAQLIYLASKPAIRIPDPVIADWVAKQPMDCRLSEKSVSRAMIGEYPKATEPYVRWHLRRLMQQGVLVKNEMRRREKFETYSRLEAF